MNLNREQKKKLNTAAGIALSDDELQKAAGGAPGTCNLYRCDLYRCDFADGCGRSFTADYRPTECPYCGSTCISLY